MSILGISVPRGNNTWTISPNVQRQSSWQALDRMVSLEIHNGNALHVISNLF